MSYRYRFKEVEEIRRRQRTAFIRSMIPLRKGSMAPAAEIALMTLAVHPDRLMMRDRLGLYNVPDHPRDETGAFTGVGFSAATIQKLVRAGRVDVNQFNENGVPVTISLKPMI